MLCFLVAMEVVRKQREGGGGGGNGDLHGLLYLWDVLFVRSCVRLLDCSFVGCILCGPPFEEPGCMVPIRTTQGRGSVAIDARRVVLPNAAAGALDFFRYFCNRLKFPRVRAPCLESNIIVARAKVVLSVSRPLLRSFISGRKIFGH